MTDADALVFISGASRGIGAALARTVPFAATVVDVSRSGGGPAAHHLEADLSYPGDWPHLSAELSRMVVELEPSRATLVHAAGTLTPIGFAGEVESVAYVRNVLLNSAAGQLLGHLFLEATSNVPGRRDVVMISSGAATTPYEGWSGYNAGKAALEQWVRTVAAEQDRRGGAGVYAIAPGVVATAMQEQIRSTEEDDFPERQKFVDLHEDGALEDPDGVARRLWSVLEDGRLTNGAVVDLREEQE